MTRVPPHWRVMPLGEVAETALGKMLDRGHPRGVTQVPYLRNVNVQWGRVDTADLLTMEISDDEQERFGVRAGDLLVCEGGEIGRAAIWPGSEDYIAYQKALHRVRPGPDLSPRFLLHFLRHAAETGVLDRLSTGSTIRHLPQQQLRRVPVALPPFEEQSQIVEILENHLSRLDAANDYLGAVRLRSETLRWAVAADRLFTSEVPTEGLRLRDVLTEFVGGVWGEPPGESDLDVDVLRVTELKPWGVIEPQTAARRSVSAREALRRRLEPGDLLLEKSGGGIATPIGRVGLVPPLQRPAVCSNFMQLMRADRSLALPRYLHLYLNTLQATGRTEHLQKASTNLRNIKTSEYGELEVRLPSLGDQGDACRAVDMVWLTLDDTAATVDASSKQSAGLRRALLAAAFSGRLTGRSSDLDLAEEMALV